jgi:hypothetical protein
METMDNLINFLNDTIIVDEKLQDQNQESTETQTEDQELVDETSEQETEQLIKEQIVQKEEVQSEQSNSDNEQVTPAHVLYEYLAEKGIVEKSDSFNPEMIEEILDDIPKNMLAKEIANLPSKTKDLLLYAYKLGDQFTDEHLEKFFAFQQIDSMDEEAIVREHLKNDRTLSRLYDTEEKIIDFIDDLKSSGELSTFSEKIKDIKKEEQKNNLQKEAEQIEQQRIENEKKSKQFIQQVYSTVDSLGWANQRKQEVLKNLEPNEVNRKNQLIRSSPLAIVQLADIYSYFDETKGEFDFSKLINAKVETKKNLQSLELLEKMKMGSSKTTASTKQNKTQDSLKIVN